MMNHRLISFCLFVFLTLAGLTLGHAQSGGCKEVPLTTGDADGAVTKRSPSTCRISLFEK